MFIFISTHLLYKYQDIYSIQKAAPIKSQEFIGHIKQPLSHVTYGIHDFVKCSIRGSLHLDLRADMPFGRLQP